MAETARVLAFDEACSVVDRWPAGPLPATLHPRYVSADARRDAALEPLFLCIERGGERWMHALHTTRIPGTAWRDASSPYGYGGPIATSRDPVFLAEAWADYAGWMRQAGVVVEFVRFHPVLGNEATYGGAIQDNREVVYVDLGASDLMVTYAVRARQAVRKAAAAGARYEEAPLAPLAAAFGAFHRRAMQAMGTEGFYLFGDGYFEALGRMHQARVGLCIEAGSGEWLAAALFLDGVGVREYHLAAASDAGRRLGAASFLLHEAAQRARAAGQATLYLGGGTSTLPDNPLLFFKAGFSPLRMHYRTGSAVFDAEAYADVEMRFAVERQAHPYRPIFHRKV